MLRGGTALGDAGVLADKATLRSDVAEGLGDNLRPDGALFAREERSVRTALAYLHRSIRTSSPWPSEGPTAPAHVQALLLAVADLAAGGGGHGGRVAAEGGPGGERVMLADLARARMVRRLRVRVGGWV